MPKAVNALSIVRRMSSLRPVDWILLAALALTTFEGAIRKWVIGSEGGVFSYLVYFSKDIAFALLLLCEMRRGVSPIFRTYQHWLGVGAVLLLVGALLSFVSSGINPVGAVLTLRATIILPLISLYAIRRLGSVRLRLVLLWVAVFGAFNFGLGIIQNRSSSDSVVNRYVSLETNVVEEDSGVRAAGTFAYITGLSTLAGVVVWGGLVLLSSQNTSFWHGVGLVSVVSGLGCGLASISRAPIYCAALLIVAWLVFAVRSNVRMIKGVVLACVLLSPIYFLFFSSTVAQLSQGLMDRSSSASDQVGERMFDQIGEGWLAATLVPFGHGFGSEQVGGNYYASGVASLTNFEGQLPRLVAETGILGTVGFIVIFAGTIVALQKARRYTKSPRDRTIILLTQCWMSFTFYSNIVFNHTASSYAWMIFAAVAAYLDASQHGSVTAGLRTRAKNRSADKKPGLKTASLLVQRHGTTG